MKHIKKLENYYEENFKFPDFKISDEVICISEGKYQNNILEYGEKYIINYYYEHIVGVTKNSKDCGKWHYKRFIKPEFFEEYEFQNRVKKYNI